METTQPATHNPRRYDLAVIGAGAAGLSVAYAAARLGLRTALIERSIMGGECLNTGCVPSKILLHAARQGAGWGEVKRRVVAGIAAIAPADSAERYTALGADVLMGMARFTGPDKLEVAGVALTARRIVIAVGSRPRIPDFCRNIAYLTNESVWSLPECPAHLLILGGGPMGFEMADAFCALGAKVSVIGAMLPREDTELAAVLVASLRARGVNFHDQKVVAAGPGARFTLRDGTMLVGSHILIAAGRVFAPDGLNLAAAGVAWSETGIKTDTGLRAGRTIFAAGDCADPQGIGPQRYTHIAGMHAGIIVRRAVFRLPAMAQTRLPATPPVRAIFTSPELAQAGMMLAQAGPGAKALTWPFAETDRAVAEGETAGLVKLVIDRRGRLVGAGIAGHGAAEMISLYALALAAKTKLPALAGLVLPYPTRAEAGKRAAGAHLAEKLFAPGPRRLVRWLARLP